MVSALKQGCLLACDTGAEAFDIIRQRLQPYGVPGARIRIDRRLILLYIMVYRF